MNEFNAIGIMSGSSLDGLDVCSARFIRQDASWSFEIDATTTYPFPEAMQSKLATARSLSGIELSLLDVSLGEWIGDQTANFIEKNKLNPQLIGSHGHTVFHQVDRRLSLQIGNPHAIAVKTQLPVVTDFRQQNVLLGGQGAPLVPIGDALLFPDYDGFVNLGGIANISCKKKGLVGGDIVPCNQVLNALASKLGLPFDDEGKVAQQGSVNDDWLSQLAAHPFYKAPLPRSISNEWVAETYLQNLPAIATNDALCTFTHFIASQISEALKNADASKVLLTGGGAFNSHLVSLLQRQLKNTEFVVPDRSLIAAKEALIFAFMAVLKQEGLVNCLASYTGANKDISAGVVYLP